MIRKLFARYTPWGKFWLCLAIVLLLAAAAMSFDFGWGVSAKHAIFLAGMSFVTAFIPDAAYEMWQENKKGAALAIAACSIPLFGLEFFSHAGYTAGLRGLNVSDTKVQNVKYDAAQDTVAENKRQLEFWQRRLETLTTQNGWTATVTADGLRAKLPSLELAIQQESSNCKARCLARTKERDEIAERIKVLEETNDLSGKIAHAKQVLANIRDKAATVEHKSSAVEHQNAFLTKAVALTVNGTLEATDVQAEKVQQAVNLGMALAGTGLPALCFFAAGLYRRREDDHTTSIKPLPTNHVFTLDTTDQTVKASLEALAKRLQVAA
jgi:hypothetical protein